MMRQRGFTLIELLVALAIFAVISAIAVPIYSSYTQRSYDREARADLMACAMALERVAGIDFSYGSTGNDWEDLDDYDANLCDPRTTRYTLQVRIPADGSRFDLRAVPISGSAVNSCPTIQLPSDGAMTGAPASGPCA